MCDNKYGLFANISALETGAFRAEAFELTLDMHPATTLRGEIAKHGTTHPQIKRQIPDKYYFLALSQLVGVRSCLRS
jgi:hypothetical protein